MNDFEACFTLTEEKVRITIDSLKPELKPGERERSTTTLSPDGDKLNIRIQAEDLHALRAAVNTYLKWLIMCDELAG